MGADKGFPAPYVLRSALPLTLHDCFPRHCEKIFDFRGSPFYSIVKFVLDCFVAFAPRNDIKLVIVRLSPTPALSWIIRGVGKFPAFRHLTGYAPLHPTENPFPRLGRANANLEHPSPLREAACRQRAEVFCVSKNRRLV